MMRQEHHLFIDGQMRSIEGFQLVELKYFLGSFLRESKIFDEVIIGYIGDNHLFSNIISYPEQRKEGIPRVNPKEIQEILNTINLDALIGWNYVATAKGSEFDVICKITRWFYVLINNTQLSIDEMRLHYDQAEFDRNAKLINKLMRDVKKNLLS
jgi:hypothetical protein